MNTKKEMLRKAAAFISALTFLSASSMGSLSAFAAEGASSAPANKSDTNLIRTIASTATASTTTAAAQTATTTTAATTTTVVFSGTTASTTTTAATTTASAVNSGSATTKPISNTTTTHTTATSSSVSTTTTIATSVKQIKIPDELKTSFKSGLRNELIKALKNEIEAKKISGISNCEYKTEQQKLFLNITYEDSKSSELESFLKIFTFDDLSADNTSFDRYSFNTTASELKKNVYYEVTGNVHYINDSKVKSVTKKIDNVDKKYIMDGTILNNDSLVLEKGYHAEKSCTVNRSVRIGNYGVYIKEDQDKPEIRKVYFVENTFSIGFDEIDTTVNIVKKDDNDIKLEKNKTTGKYTLKWSEFEDYVVIVSPNNNCDCFRIDLDAGNGIYSHFTFTDNPISVKELINKKMEAEENELENNAGYSFSVIGEHSEISAEIEYIGNGESQKGEETYTLIDSKYHIPILIGKGDDTYYLSKCEYQYADGNKGKSPITFGDYNEIINYMDNERKGMIEIESIDSSKGLTLNDNGKYLSVKYIKYNGGEGSDPLKVFNNCRASLKDSRTETDSVTFERIIISPVKGRVILNLGSEYANCELYFYDENNEIRNLPTDSSGRIAFSLNANKLTFNAINRFEYFDEEVIEEHVILRNNSERDISYADNDDKYVIDSEDVIKSERIGNRNEYTQIIERIERDSFRERKITVRRVCRAVPLTMRPFTVLFDDTAPEAEVKSEQTDWTNEIRFTLNIDDSFGSEKGDKYNIDRINNIAFVNVGGVQVTKESLESNVALNDHTIWSPEAVYSGTGTAKDGKTKFNVKVKPVKADKGNSHFDVTVTVDGTNGEFITDDFIVYVEDHCENKSKEETVSTNIEGSAPIVRNIKLSKTNKNVCKDELEMTASVDDQYPEHDNCSGIDDVKVYFSSTVDGKSKLFEFNATSGTENGTVKPKAETYSSALKLTEYINECNKYEGYLIVSVKDSAGNEKKYYYSDNGDSNVTADPSKATVIKLDSEKPEDPTLALIGGKGNGGYWFETAPEVKITAKDDDVRDSGIEKLKIWLTRNGATIGTDGNLDITLSDITNAEKTLNAEEQLKKGNFKIVFTPVNESGKASPDNKFSSEYLCAKPHIVIDGYTLENDPYADKIINLKNDQDRDYHFSIRVQSVDYGGNPSNESRQRVDFDLTPPEIVNFKFAGREDNEKIKKGSKDYRTRYKNFIRSNVKVKINVKDDYASSGLQSVEVKLIDKDGNEIEPRNYTEHFDDGYVEFEINEEFKGDVIAEVFDNVGHGSGVWASNGVISDTPENHINKAKIEVKLPDTEHRDKAGRALYNSDINAEIIVSDSQSGIKKIEWSHDSQDDTSEFSEESVKNRSFDGWKVDDNIERNIVTKASRTIGISNEGNGNKLHVEMMDNARNNLSPDDIQFSIDKIPPEITLEGIEKSDAVKYYNTHKTAYITVKDMNLQLPVITGADAPEFEHNEDDTEVKCKIDFTNDGRYRLDVTNTDLAGNEAEPKGTGTFVIDTTAPKASIDVRRTSGASVRTGDDAFVGSDVEAAVFVEELNFDPDSISITVNGNVFSSGSWYGENTHSLLVPNSYFSKDGKYDINVTGKDLAGNSMKPVSVSFTIDRKKPVISIGGISAANNGEVAPVISVNEDNPDSQSVDVFRNEEKLAAVVEDNGNVVKYMVNEDSFITGRWNKESSENTGSRMVFDNFPSEEEFDGSYRIGVTIKDKADNESSQEKTFSVNRFGSVFTIENEDEINGCHLRKAPTIMITERNVDKHSDSNEVTIIVDKGSDIVSLTEEEYTVSGPVQLDDKSGYEYVYTIDSKVFDKDLDYKVSVQTVDAAGNKNLSSLRNADISFSIDTHEPDFKCDDLADRAEFRQSQREFRLNVNEKLRHIRVTTSLNEVLLNAAGKEGGDSSYVFVIPASNTARDLTIELIDLAGNITVKAIKNLLVTENIVLYAMHKTWAKAAASAAVGLGAAGGAVLLRRRKRKNRL